MTSAVTQLSLSEHASQSLAQVFKQTTLDNPCYISITKEAFVFEPKAASTTLSNDRCELVVFSTLTLSLLIELTKTCNITLIALTKINHRASLTSYRFTIRTNNITASIKLLADFINVQNIEAAIIDHAPSLDKPGLLVMDMDSTTIEIECIDEIAVLAGVGEQVAEVTERAMQGQLDFAQSLHQRVATLAGSPVSILADVAKDIPLMPGLTSLVETLKAHQWRVAIASGGFTYFADHLQQLLGLDAAYANTLEIVDNKLTGKVVGDVVDAQAKADCLSALREKYAIDKNQTVAMGDGANDLVMMNAAHLGVAFHAKPIVLKQADTSINNGGLDLMLHWLV
ncbi:phosphoserine phosphatase SerB [Thalassotalea sediminis]|uniref:phosphoserine phosphatase SerB n=1 Tax=Thalassotalea sediminis TaxID=1759089 RepID=UPI002573FD3D|nr:phosphoserine phosphatase SerB [Thalassotalea sediminis]